MANDYNLIPANKRSKSEHREIAKKGGIASGKARRKKANLKKAIDLILSSTVPNEQLGAVLRNLGFEDTNEMAVAFITLQKALKGDMRAIELFAKMNSNEGTKDSIDKKEQKERIKSIELKNKREEKMLDSDMTNKRIIEINVGDWNDNEE
mgnify:CR=1 FL=1